MRLEKLTLTKPRSAAATSTIKLTGAPTLRRREHREHGGRGGRSEPEVASPHPEFGVGK
jgi:hypothetical protein